MAIEVNVANGDRSTVLDLYHGTLKIVGRTWQTGDAEEHTTKKARGEYGADVAFSHFLPVMESFQLVGAGTSSQLRAEIRRLQDAIEGARKYRTDPLEDETWWWEVNAAGEPARRSLIYRGSLQPAAEPTVDPFLRRPSMKWQVALERHPFFEPLTGSSLSTLARSTTGGVYRYSGIPGAVPARISELVLHAPVDEMDIATTVWLGFRPKYDGTADFEPVWPLAEGTEGTDATVAADATAYSGERVTVSFATAAGWAQRVALRLYAVSGYHSPPWTGNNITHYRGRYLVLGRVKLSAANTAVGLRLKGKGQSPGGDQFITNTVWRLVPLGYVQIPAWGGFDPGLNWGHYSTWEVAVHAKRVEGAGSLYLDCLILIPQPHAVTVQGTTLGGAAPYDVRVLTLPDDRRVAFGYWEAAESAGETLTFSAPSLYIPPGDGVMVVAADYATGHVLDGTLSVSATYYPRWKSYREDTT